MPEPKNAKDMEKTAHELLLNIIGKFYLKSKWRNLVIDVEPTAQDILAHYLLDAYNEGYDDAIVQQTKRIYKID